MAHISLPPWSDLYDSSKNDVVTSTNNSTLNGKLYSKVLLSLDGSAYQNFVSRKHLRVNGILLLHELVQTYKPKNVSEIIAAKTVEFWGNTKHLPTESIDSYYDRFQELLEDLADADEPISPKAAIHQFIFMLGNEFETIQNNFRINNLPAKWNTQDWPTLLTLCRDDLILSSRIIKSLVVLLLKMNLLIMRLIKRKSKGGFLTLRNFLKKLRLSEMSSWKMNLSSF